MGLSLRHHHELQGLVGDSAVKCRLFYLVGNLHTGGLERQLCYLLQVMDRRRYKPAVAVWSYSDEDIHLAPIRELGVPLYSFPRRLSGAAKLRAFRRLVEALEPQVVHSYSFYTNIAAYWAARGTRSVAIGSVRSDFTWAKKNSGPWLGRLSARWPHDQICNSYSAAEAARRSKSAFAPRRLYVVRNGLDLNRFQNLPLPRQNMVPILGVGYLLPVKRWDWLLVAARELKGKGFDFLIRIAGDGPLRWTLEHQARDLGVTDRVEFTGHVDDVMGLLADTRFLVHTSENEGCPNAVMEAMACGRAVIATDAGDIPSLVEDGKTGFVVRRGDNTTFVESMVKLITDRELCRRMGQAARMKAEREFGLDRLVQETLAVYRSAGWKDA